MQCALMRVENMRKNTECDMGMGGSLRLKWTVYLPITGFWLGVFARFR